jgi:hypothetical protein
MAPDPARIADTRAWLTKSAHDLRRVDILLGADTPDVEGAVFHSQQAAEKAFKAFLRAGFRWKRAAQNPEAVAIDCSKVWHSSDSTGRFCAYVNFGRAQLH